MIIPKVNYNVRNFLAKGKLELKSFSFLFQVAGYGLILWEHMMFP